MELTENHQNKVAGSSDIVRAGEFFIFLSFDSVKIYMYNIQRHSIITALSKYVILCENAKKIYKKVIF